MGKLMYSFPRLRSHACHVLLVKVVALRLGDKKVIFWFFLIQCPKLATLFYFLFDKNCTFGSKVTKEKLSMENTEIIQNVCYPKVNTCILFLKKISKYKPSKTEAATREFHGSLSLTIIEQTDRSSGRYPDLLPKPHKNARIYTFCGVESRPGVCFRIRPYSKESQRKCSIQKESVITTYYLSQTTFEIKCSTPTGGAY